MYTKNVFLSHICIQTKCDDREQSIKKTNYKIGHFLLRKTEYHLEYLGLVIYHILVILEC